MAILVPIQVLVADDHRRMRDWICSLLKREPDIQVVGEAADGQQALDQARQLYPDLLLLDIEMPVMDGIQVVKTLRIQRFPVHILILSSYAEDAYIEMVLALGVCGYLIKEHAPRLLTQEIRRIVLQKPLPFGAEAKLLPRPSSPDASKTRSKAA